MRTIVRFFQKKAPKSGKNPSASRASAGGRAGETRTNPDPEARNPEPEPRTPDKKRPSPEEPDPESPMCCYLLVFADYLLPDNVGVHIDNLLWVSQICGHFSEVVFLVLLNGADDVKGF